MRRKDFQSLQPGDLVRGLVSGQVFVVTGNYGTHVTAVRTVDLTNPSEWDIVTRQPLEFVEVKVKQVTDHS
jgi:hypothetical protein